LKVETRIRKKKKKKQRQKENVTPKLINYQIFENLKRERERERAK